jgi:hypothetical protein
MMDILKRVGKRRDRVKRSLQFSDAEVRFVVSRHRWRGSVLRTGGITTEVWRAVDCTMVSVDTNVLASIDAMRCA